ncbi:MAG: glycosyltransferase [Pseudomonadota bacterium]
MGALVGAQPDPSGGDHIIIGLDAAKRAANQLPDRAPHLSCRDGFTRASAFWFIGILGLFAGLVLSASVQTVVWILGLSLIFLLVSYRTVLVFLGRLRPATPVPEGANDWPIYTILVPLYREAASVPALVNAIRSFDYPIDRLDVIFLIERDDVGTRTALMSQDLLPGTQILDLPNGTPRTKPRALNVGLAYARGEFVTVYDAEDRPHPKQLVAAIAALSGDANKDLACVQAPLRAHNISEGWITAHWGLEYDIQFGLILPALAAARLPMALGGTSNHFRTSALRAAGAWDAWNVTEDADLGLRLARFGWRTGVIAPPTLEEAPESFAIWTAQRSRWIKGYMQTFGVLMRTPIASKRRLGWRGAASTLLLLGGAIASAFAHGPLALWCLICLLMPGMGLGPFSLAVLLLGYGSTALAAALAPRARGVRRLKLLLTLPLYWPLLSIAAVRALYELIAAPHYWAKTPHGLTVHRPAESLSAFI